LGLIIVLFSHYYFIIVYKYFDFFILLLFQSAGRSLERIMQHHKSPVSTSYKIMGLHETFDTRSQSILAYKTIIFLALKILHWAIKPFLRYLIQNYKPSLAE
jgi:hypothetical protein